MTPKSLETELAIGTTVAIDDGRIGTLTGYRGLYLLVNLDGEEYMFHVGRVSKYNPDGGDESFESIERVLRPGMGQFAITYRVEVGSRETAVHLVNAYSHDEAATEGDRLFGSRMIDVERCM